MGVGGVSDKDCLSAPERAANKRIPLFSETQRGTVELQENHNTRCSGANLHKLSAPPRVLQHGDFNTGLNLLKNYHEEVNILMH